MTSATKSWARMKDHDRAERSEGPTLQPIVEFTDTESDAAVKISKARGWRGFRVAGARLATGKAIERFAPHALEFTLGSLDGGKLPQHILETGETVVSLPASDGPRVFVSPRDLEGCELVIWWHVSEDLRRVRSARMVGWLTSIEIQERPLRPGKFGDQWSIRVEDLRTGGGPRWSGQANTETPARVDPRQTTLASLERSRDACADAIGQGVWVHMTAERSEVWELREHRKDGEPAHRLVEVFTHKTGEG